MAADAKSYEILSRVIARVASALNMMYLKAFHAPAAFGNASCLDQELHGRVDDSFRGPASNVAVWIQFESSGHLNAFEEFLPLRHRKTEYQPREP